MTHVRSTLLSSSILIVRERGLMDRYLGLLPREHHDTMLTMVAGAWFPIDLALSHYAAMNELGFTPDEQFAIGQTITVKIQQSVLMSMVRLARGAGATPFVAAAQFHRLWSRLLMGGAGVVYRTGPKEARFEGHNVPLAQFPYFRNAWRGLIAGSFGLFCQRIYVRELPRYVSDTTVGYRAQWV
jgi:hypothetical protein